VPLFNTILIEISKPYNVFLSSGYHAILAKGMALMTKTTVITYCKKSQPIHAGTYTNGPRNRPLAHIRNPTMVIGCMAQPIRRFATGERIENL